MNTLMKASHEWATRPDDQRFGSLNELYLASWLAAQQSTTHDLGQHRLQVEVENGRLQLVSPIGAMDFTHWSFGQLSQRVGAPAAWLRQLEPELAAQNLNAGLKLVGGTFNDTQMYLRQNAEMQRPKLLALTGTKYGRIYNHEVVAAVKGMPGNWVSPLSMLKSGEVGRPATEDDLKYGTNIQLGQMVSQKRALYGGDSSMFIFLVDNDRRISDGSDGGLGRGFWVENSEVGDATFSITRFWYRYVCMNNIVWGAQNVERVSVKHSGRGARFRAFDKLALELKAYAEASATDDEAKIKSAQRLALGLNLEDVQELVFADKRITTKKNVTDAYELATQHPEDGDPNTAWGLANGLTRLSQIAQFTDERVGLDKAAGRVLALAA